MTQKTRSEHLFEQYCENQGIRCKSVPTGQQKTPDYEITIDSQKIIVEVKQIDPNPTEVREIEKLKTGQATGLVSVPGNRVRGKISDASSQLSRRAHGRYPTMLVIYNNVPLAEHTDPYDIRVAMEGEEIVEVAVPHDPHKPPYVKQIRSGGKRKMTPSHNTSISAIAVLHVDRSGKPNLVLYHNRHAANPLDSKLFKSFGVKQDALEDNGET